MLGSAEELGVASLVEGGDIRIGRVLWCRHPHAHLLGWKLGRERRPACRHGRVRQFAFLGVREEAEQRAWRAEAGAVLTLRRAFCDWRAASPPRWARGRSRATTGRASLFGPGHRRRCGGGRPAIERGRSTSTVAGTVAVTHVVLVRAPGTRRLRTNHTTRFGTADRIEIRRARHMPSPRTRWPWVVTWHFGQCIGWRSHVSRNRGALPGHLRYASDAAAGALHDP